MSSTTIGVVPIRLFCDLAARGQPLLDINTGAPPAFYRGDDIEVDIGLGQAGSLFAPTLANIGSVTCAVYARENDTSAPLMCATVAAASMNLALTQANWNAGGPANSHAQFIFPNSQTVISLGGQPSVNYWLRIFLATADSPPKQITLAEGPISISDGPITGLSAPAGAKFRGWVVAGQTVLQIQNDTDGHYYTLGAETINGVVTFYVGQTPF